MKKLSYINLAIIAAALALEASPWGAVCNFAVAPESGGGVDRQTFSYFDLTPFGYANFGPFLTALLSCVLLVLTVIGCFALKGGLLKCITGLSAAAAVSSLLPLAFGISFYSVVGLLITLLLMASTATAAINRRKITQS